jgi:hypothetical protein
VHPNLENPLNNGSTVCADTRTLKLCVEGKGGSATEAEINAGFKAVEEALF